MESMVGECVDKFDILNRSTNKGGRPEISNPRKPEPLEKKLTMT